MNKMKITSGRLIAFAVSIFLICSCKSEFSFVQLSDPQFGFIGNNKDVIEESRLFEKAVIKINELKPEFVVITGDLVNDKSDQKQWDEFKRIIARFSPGIKVYIVPGNHDMGHELTEKDLKDYESMIGPGMFSWTYGKSRFIGINSNLIKSDVQPFEQDQLLWLKKQLAEAKGSKHIVIFCHHPFFINDPSEPEQYFNIKPEIRDRYLSLFGQYGVDAVFAGHLHKNAEARFKNIMVITTSSVGKQLGDDKPGFRLVTVDGDKIEHKYFDLEE